MVEKKLEKVESIVKKMKERYKEKGLSLSGETDAELKELRDIILGKPKVKFKTIEQLKESKNKIIKFIANTYEKFSNFFAPMLKFFSNTSFVKSLDYYLYSSHMRFNVAQWLIISIVSASLASVITFFSLSLLLAWLAFSITIIFTSSLIFSIGIFFLTLGSLLYYPNFRAKRRAAALEAELPFALRHLATQLRSGIGLFKALQTIAAQDYGVLSEELSRTITQIEEGTETKDALSKLAYYTQSNALKKAVAHIIRALRTGGNLSDVMTSLASDVSFEQRSKLRDFAERMNFFGVIFIFVAIVLPVFIAILSAIANSPVSKMFIAAMPLTPSAVTLFYAFIMPLALLLLVIYLKYTQPGA